MSIQVNQPMRSKAGLFKNKRKEFCGDMGMLQHSLGKKLPTTEISSNRKQARAVKPTGVGLGIEACVCQK
jgi:hypothetical protein